LAQSNHSAGQSNSSNRASESNRSESGRKAPRPDQANAGKPWSADQDQQLLDAFDRDVPLAEIARLHGRTVGGVRARLEKHGRLEPSAATRWPSDGARGGSAGGGKGHPESARQDSSS